MEEFLTAVFISIPITIVIMYFYVSYHISQDKLKEDINKLKASRDKEQTLLYHALIEMTYAKDQVERDAIIEELFKNVDWS